MRERDRKREVVRDDNSYRLTNTKVKSIKKDRDRHKKEKQAMQSHR